MKKLILNELNTLSKSKFQDQSVVQTFRKRLESPLALTRDESSLDHFCAFYLPTDRENKKIYLIVHKKTGLWMPPGGHLDRGENSRETVIRECREELDHELSPDVIELYNASIEPINNAIYQQCRIHYTLWYLVHTGHQDFNLNRIESDNGRWMSLKEARKRVTYPSYRDRIIALHDYLAL